MRKLHAKVYVSDAGVAIGSANLSSGAFDAGTLEALAVLRAPAHVHEAQAWFDALTRDAQTWRAIKADTLTYRRICAAYAAKRGGSGARAPRVKLLKAFEEPEALGRYLVVNVIDDNEPAVGKSAARRAAASTERTLPEGWTHDSYQPATPRHERDANATPAGMMVLTVRVATRGDSATVTEFRSIDDEIVRWVGATLAEGVLFGFYEPLDAAQTPVGLPRLDLSARSRHAFVQALNAGLQSRPALGQRLASTRAVAPRRLSQLLAT